MRLLIVEDSDDDALLIVRELKRAGYAPTHARVETEAAFRGALDGESWDIVLSDYSMPQFTGAAALQLLRERDQDTPFIFVSGTIGEEVAVEAMRAGAQDYVTKGNLRRLVPAIERELRDAALRRERRDALSASEARLRAILRAALDAHITMDEAGTITGWNPQAEATFGWVEHDVLGKVLSDVIIPPANREAHLRGLRRFLATAEGPILGRRLELIALRRDGQEFPVELAVAPIRLGDTWIFSAFVRDITERRAAEDALRRSEERYRLLFDSGPHPMWVYDIETLRFITVNDAAVRHYGYSRAEFLEMTVEQIRPPEDVPALRQHLAAVRAGHLDQAGVWRHRKKDGTLIDVDIVRYTLQFEGKAAALVLAQDVTERRLLEQQLRQAQKMEAVGRLAGGIAHDFNNLLTAIFGYADLLAEDLPPGSPAQADVKEIRTAATRASALTRQLLAFSRQQVLQPVVLNVNVVVGDLENMLQRVLGEDVELEAHFGADLGNTRADPGQLEQVILNLAVNARDAMPTGGKLTIETANVALDEHYAQTHRPVVPGRYVMVAVSDTGIGMDAATQARMFEPFFTTKEKSKGTGLGLATAYGIVKQSGGYIWVYSEVGRGATFKIYLPRVDAPADVVAAPPELGTVAGTETVLLAEDDPLLLPLARDVLKRLGYTVLEARTPAGAVTAAQAHNGVIHLLISDVVMPGESGLQLARRLLEVRPNLRVLYMSGYSDEAVVRHGLLDPGTTFLQKPFTPAALARKVRELLDAAPPTGRQLN